MTNYFEEFEDQNSFSDREIFTIFGLRLVRFLNLYTKLIMIMSSLIFNTDTDKLEIAKRSISQ
jgi:hypothetical protein